MRPIQHTLGSYPGLRFTDAMSRALADTHLGGTAHVQLCPQNHGILDLHCDELAAMSPHTQFRLHANVRIEGHERHYDASSTGNDADAYFRGLAAMSHRLGASVYTLHAGDRLGRDLEVLAARIRWLEDTFGHKVGVEGHYPALGNRYWLSSWEEYRWLLDSGLDYALDLSHLHIVATRARRAELGLTRELLASERCIEVHLSGNDGLSDLHVRLADCPDYWWKAALDAIHPAADIFYEGNEVRGDAASARVREKMARKPRIDVAH